MTLPLGRTLDARQQAEKQARVATSEEAIRIAKERRFSLSASMLTEKKIDVTVINNPNAPMAAMDVRNNKLMLNEGDKRLDMSEPIKALVYTRASLFHEIDHALFTRDCTAKMREMSLRVKDSHAFDLLRNILEDGRIEALGKKKFAGQADFFNATLMDIINKMGASPFDGLHLYVRTGLFRNKNDEQFWTPYRAQIDKAIRATSTSQMLDIAFDIANALAKPQAPQSQQGEGEQKEQEQNEQGASANEDSASDVKNDEQGEDSDDAQNDASDESSDAEGDSEGEGDSAEGSEGDESEGEEGAGDSASDEEGEGEAQGEGEASDSAPIENFDKEISDKLNKLMDEATKRCEAEAESDYEAILAEAEAYEPEQAYLDDQESAASDELASAFTSLLVESARCRYFVSRAGLLNQATLANALTSRKCFHKREETPETPHVALLLDVSGSMMNRAHDLSVAARVLNGALRKAKVNTLALTFGGDELSYGDASCLNKFKTIPADAPLVVHGWTPTHLAMRAANDWMENEGATRGLIIVVTDGAPNELTLAQNELQRAEQGGAYVIGVLVGIAPNTYTPRRLTGIASQFHDHAFCPNVADLPNVVAPLLAQYIAQS